MKIESWLKRTVNVLKDSNIGTARLDSLVLLEDVTGKERSWLLAHPEENLTELLMLQGSTLLHLEDKVRRRAKHEPLSYIRGKTEFYGREFTINKDVLEPRPESETMIDLLKKLLLPQQLLIADIGTGSGAICISVKLELPSAEVIATDIDPKCLVVAKKNAEEFGTEIKFFKGNLLQPLKKLALHALLCNLPYVPDNYQLNSAAMNEPKIAIFGGPDGLDLYRQLFKQIDSLAVKPIYVLTESLPPQHKKLTAIAKTHDYKLDKTADFIQIFKILN